MEEELLENLDKAKALLILKESEGGKLLYESLKRDIETNLIRIVANYSEWTHIRLQSEIATLAARKQMLDSINDSADRVKSYEEEIQIYKNNN